jgi:penicillin-binding protein 1A
MKKGKNLTYINFKEPALAGGTASEKPRRPSTGKKPPLKKGQLTTSQKVKGVLGVIGTTMLIIMLIAVITVCIVAVALTVYVMQFAENSFDIDLAAAEMSFTSVIKVFDPDAGAEEDEDGEIIPGEGEWVEVQRLSGDENRIWIDIDEIPLYVIDAVVANEDHRYFEHEGVDWYGTVGVMVNALLSDTVRGGSTITQQLVKNVTGDDGINAGRKLREIFRALSLEQKYTKLDILEAYLNRISFGGTSNGVMSAAWYYFDKDVRDVTIAEAALMAAVIPSPHFNNPYNNPERARERQLIALQQMFAHGFITTAEYEEAQREQVRFRRPIRGEYWGYEDERYHDWFGLQGGDDYDEDLYFENVDWDDLREHPYRWDGDYELKQDWYVDAGIWQVATHLAEQRGVTYEKALDLIRNGGYTIYLNVDITVQRKLEDYFREPTNFMSFYDSNAAANNVLQGAFVIMDYSGRVVALAGGIGEKPGHNCFNRATQSVRAIGSTIKPLSVYGPAIDMDLVTYSTLIRDVSGERRINQADLNSPTERWPFNYEQNFPGTGSYYPVWYAVQQSHNTIAVRTLQKVGFQAAYTMLVDRLGFSDLSSTWDMNWSPLALGAFTNGARLHELAAAYAIFGNGGVYFEPFLYERVVDNSGKTVLEQSFAGVQAIEKDSAWVNNRILQRAVSGRAAAQIPNVETGGKTGTSNDFKDLLFCGLTPDYVGVYRLGYDNGREMNVNQSIDGWRSTIAVWGGFMSQLYEDIVIPRAFTADPTVQRIPYCRDTGLLATTNCFSTELGYYKAGNRPPACCATTHDPVDVGRAINADPVGFLPQYN